MNCADCKFSGLQMNPGQKTGMICRRYPPKSQGIPVPTQQGISVNFITTYPIVTDSDYCYEFSNGSADKSLIKSS